MSNRSATLAVVALLSAALNAKVSPGAEVSGLQLKELEHALCAAASVSANDMRALSQGKLNAVGDFERTTLTALLLCDRPIPGAGEARAKEFECRSESGQLRIYHTIKMITMADGAGSFLRTDHVKIAQAEDTGERVSGKVEFAADDCFHGVADFETRRSGGEWHIVSFTLPVRRQRVVFTDDKQWVVESLNEKRKD